MIPILYEKTETSFTSNGLGRLRDCISCEVTEERNGIYEVDFEYPVNGQHYSDILLGRIIAVEHDETGDIQPFDIVSYSRPINGVVSFHGVHISYRQRGIALTSANVTSLQDAFDDLVYFAHPSNPCAYSSDMTKSGYVAAFDGMPHTVRELLGGLEGSILDTYGGEYEWDKFTVRLWQSRGEARDFTIRYGVNLTEYTEESDISDSYTAVIPYWSGNDNTLIGAMISSGQKGPSGREICVPLDLSDKFENEPTPAQLHSAASSYLSVNRPYLPAQTIKVDFVRLQDSDEYYQYANLQKCRLCDTVNVVFPMYGMSGRFRIVKTVWDVLLERYTEMELGTLSTTLSEALGISSSSGGSSGSGATEYASGTITGSSVTAGSYLDYSVTFANAFSTTPTVVACFQSTSVAGAFGRCTLGIVSTTTTGFTVRVFNGDTSGRAPNINWIAIA